jgi:tetratricopeptide (TPR) repeat protein
VRLIGLAVLLAACRPTPLLPPTVDAAPPTVIAVPLSVPGDARQRYLQAAVAERRGELERAETQYRWVTRLDATSPWPWLALGRFLERQRRWEDALEAYRRATEEDPELAEAHLAYGACAVRSGDVVAGLPSLSESSKRGHPQGRHFYARALAMTGQQSAAQVVLEAWLTEPVAQDDIFDRARLSYEFGYDDAVVDDLLTADWLMAPPPAGELLLDAAARACRLGDAWQVAQGNAFVSRVDPGWGRVAASIARRVGDPWLLAEAEPGAAAMPDGRRGRGPSKRCLSEAVPEGCSGVDVAWTAWQAAPLNDEVIDVLTDRVSACPEQAPDNYDALLRWLHR